MRIFNAETQRCRGGRGDGRVEHVERVEGDGGLLTQRRRGAECAEGVGRVEHVERVEGDGGFSTQRRRDAECAEGFSRRDGSRVR